MHLNDFTWCIWCIWMILCDFGSIEPNSKKHRNIEKIRFDSVRYSRKVLEFLCTMKLNIKRLPNRIKDAFVRSNRTRTFWYLFFCKKFDSARSNRTSKWVLFFTLEIEKIRVWVSCLKLIRCVTLTKINAIQDSLFDKRANHNL
jgi:hypothetical protein